jgi:hypothetical protein
MNTRDLTRVIVIKTNTLWPFIFLNRIPYQLALKTFIYIFSSHKEVNSIYLRHGMSKKNWVPAVSDIDLTVIINSNMSTEQEYAFLKVFWRKFKKLKKIFPMLGEVDILSENEIECWTRFTIRGYEAGNWKLLYGERNVKSNYKVDQNVLAVDSINYALTNYLEYFIPKFYSMMDSDFIVSVELSRLATKILRYTNSSFDTNTIKSNETGSKKKAELLYNIMKGFEKSISNIKPSTFQGNHDFNQLMPFPDVNQELESEINGIDLDSLNGCLNKIDSFIISYTARFIILKEGINTEEIIDCIDTVGKVFTEHNIKPVILNFALFEYYLRIYNPFIYSQLLDSRKVLFGEDLFLKIKQPDYYFYRKSLIDETGNVLLFPQGSFLFNRNSIRNYIRNGFNSKANRALFLKLYLEKSIIEPRYNQCVEECKKFYPQYVQQVNHLTGNYNHINEDQLSFDTYKLLKSLSSEINL